MGWTSSFSLRGVIGSKYTTGFTKVRTTGATWIKSQTTAKCRPAAIASDRGDLRRTPLRPCANGSEKLIAARPKTKKWQVLNLCDLCE
jgi:hypothetical protein